MPSPCCPPTTSTCPPGSTVAVCSTRPSAISAPATHCPVPGFQALGGGQGQGDQPVVLADEAHPAGHQQLPSRQAREQRGDGAGAQSGPGGPLVAGGIVQFGRESAGGRRPTLRRRALFRPGGAPCRGWPVRRPGARPGPSVWSPDRRDSRLWRATGPRSGPRRPAPGHWRGGWRCGRCGCWAWAPPSASAGSRGRRARRTQGRWRRCPGPQPPARCRPRAGWRCARRGRGTGARRPSSGRPWGRTAPWRPR